MEDHEKFMRECLKLAEKGAAFAAPNPMVGSVVVRNGIIIGSGYHEVYGGPHAEVNAVRSVVDKELLKSSTLYVNLEPCSHFGKTPPCADLIIENSIPEVVIGSIDSNSLVAGQGIQKLEKAGIKVHVGVLENECRELNRRFFTHHEKKRPYIILKWAQTKDGFIDHHRSTPGQKALQVSSAEAKKIVHQWRSEEQAILVGTNTAMLDNPMLTVREVEGKNPLRVTIDKWLRIPRDYRLYDKSAPTLIFNSKIDEVDDNITFKKIDFEKDVIAQILEELYKMNIRSVLVEGGEQVLNSFISAGAWDEARVFISEQEISHGVPAPKLLLEPSEQRAVGSDRLLVFRRK
jgi:diaminohydroxyphosphoribosylaminopyrimidine deaminase/5-amino-6-(5-phosphoribosylamino)uracil reductase